MEYGHGGDVYRNQNVELDFSINVNPLGMPNFVWEAAMKSIALSTRYPDSTCGALRARMSELTGIPGEMMIFGNGAAELIFRLVQTLCPKKAVIPAPSFMEYETALKACGTEVSFFYLKESESFFRISGISEKRTPRYDLFVYTGKSDRCDDEKSGSLKDPRLLQKSGDRCRDR